MRLTCWLAATLIAVAAPAAAQNRMDVTPKKVACAKGGSVPLVVKVDRGAGWRTAHASEWHTLVQPETLGRVEIRGGKLTFVGNKPGTGKLHVWHKTRLSHSGLYVVLEVTVEAGETRPVAPLPARAGGLLCYRTDTVPPTLLRTGMPMAVQAGQRIPLMVVRARAPSAPVALSLGASPGVRVLETRGQRGSFQIVGKPGAEVQVAARCGRTGLSSLLRFAVVAAPVPTRVRMWYRVGLTGSWTLLPRGASLVVPPGGVAFLTAEAVDRDDRALDRPVSLAHEDDMELGVRNVGGKIWILAAGKPRRMGAIHEVAASVPGTRLRRVVRVQLGG